MSEKEEIYDVLDSFHSTISNILFKHINKIDITKDLKKFTEDFYDFKEMYKKIEAPVSKENASNKVI